MARKPKAAPAQEPNPVGRPSDYDPAYCARVEAFMAEGYSLSAFAGHIGVARSTINEWMGKHEEFSEAVSRAKGARLLHWERAAMKVAERGGGPGTATVIVFGLKNMGGDEWADIQRKELTGKNGAPLQTQDVSKPDLSKLTVEELRAYERLLAKLEG